MIACKSFAKAFLKWTWCFLIIFVILCIDTIFLVTSASNYLIAIWHGCFLQIEDKDDVFSKFLKSFAMYFGFLFTLWPLKKDWGEQFLLGNTKITKNHWFSHRHLISKDSINIVWVDLCILHPFNEKYQGVPFLYSSYNAYFNVPKQTSHFSSQKNSFNIYRRTSNLFYIKVQRSF